jgi:hypothetical protein
MSQRHTLNSLLDRWYSSCWKSLLLVELLPTTLPSPWLYRVDLPFSNQFAMVLLPLWFQRSHTRKSTSLSQPAERARMERKSPSRSGGKSMETRIYLSKIGNGGHRLLINCPSLSPHSSPRRVYEQSSYLSSTHLSHISSNSVTSFTSRLVC